MNYRQSPFGPVAIIPATALRNNRTLLRQLEHPQSWKQQKASSGATSNDIPINVAYYLSPPRRTTSTPLPLAPSVPTTLRRQEPSMYYPTPSYYPSSPRVYRTRSYTTTSIFNEPINGRATPTHLKAVSGPVKYPEPLYRKRAYSRSRSADWMTSGASIRGWTPAPSTIHYPPQPVMDSPMRALGRRSYHYYPASYVTYPPSTFYGRTEKEPLLDNVYSRLALKVAQLVVGAIVIGTVAGPAQGEPFATFSARTQSGGQVYVLIIACICFIMTIALLSTIFFAKRSRIWRNVQATAAVSAAPHSSFGNTSMYAVLSTPVRPLTGAWLSHLLPDISIYIIRIVADGIFSACAAILYLVAGCVEAWYANCYPPFGNAHPEACKLVAWAICAIFAFVNMVFYTIDFVLAAQAGIDF